MKLINAEPEIFKSIYFSENDDDDSDENVESPEILQNKVILNPV